MKVLHLSTYDYLGGAGRAAFRLHTSLNRIGVDSNMYVSYRHSNDPKVMVHCQAKGLREKLHIKIRNYRLRNRLRYYEKTKPNASVPFSLDEVEYGKEVGKSLPSCDILHLHWISGFPQHHIAGLVDYQKFFPKVSPEIPIVWTMHDLNVFTGGCHYTLGCEKFTGVCGSCPILGSNNDTDLSYRVQRRKLDVFRSLGSRRVCFVANGKWMEGEARRSSLLNGFDIKTIGLGLDTQVFAPRNREAAREVLGIPKTARIVAFGAAHAGDFLKGSDMIKDIFRHLSAIEQLFFLSFGGGKLILNKRVDGLNLGRIDEERLLSLVYSAADVFIAPSREESFGQVALEATACGVPVVAFKVGGLTEVVRPQINGLLAEPFDKEQFAMNIRRLLEDEQMRRRCNELGPKMVKQEYDILKKADKYRELYNSLLN